MEVTASSQCNFTGLKMQPHIETFLFSQGQGEERNNLPLQCLTTQEALDEAIKKLRSLFWENDAIAAM